MMHKDNPGFWMFIGLFVLLLFYCGIVYFCPPATEPIPSLVPTPPQVETKPWTDKQWEDHMKSAIRRYFNGWRDPSIDYGDKYRGRNRPELPWEYHTCYDDAGDPEDFYGGCYVCTCKTTKGGG
jgi:hypothetical protein